MQVTVLGDDGEDGGYLVLLVERGCGITNSARRVRKGWG